MADNQDLKDLIGSEDDLEKEVMEELGESNDDEPNEAIVDNIVSLEEGDLPVEVDPEDLAKNQEGGENIEELIDIEEPAPEKKAPDIGKFLKDEIFPIVDKKYPDNKKILKDAVSIVFESLVRRSVDFGSLFDIDKEQLASSIIPAIYNELRHHFETTSNPTAKSRSAMAEWLTLNSTEDGEIKNVIYIDNEPTAYIVMGGDEEHLILEANNRIVGELSFLSQTGKDKSVSPIQFKLPTSTVIVKWDKFNQISISGAVTLTEKGRHPEYSATESSGKFVNQIDTKLKGIEELDGESALKLMRLASENISAAAEICRKNGVDLQSVVSALAMSGVDESEVSSPSQPVTHAPPPKKNVKNLGSLTKFLKRP